MTLTVLKNGGKRDFLAKFFDMKAPAFEQIIMKYIRSISEFMYETFSMKVDETVTMSMLVDEKKLSRRFRVRGMRRMSLFNNTTGHMGVVKKENTTLLLNTNFRLQDRGIGYTIRYGNYG